MKSFTKKNLWKLLEVTSGLDEPRRGNLRQSYVSWIGTSAISQRESPAQGVILIVLHIALDIVRKPWSSLLCTGCVSNADFFSKRLQGSFFFAYELKIHLQEYFRQEVSQQPLGRRCSR